MFFGRSNIVKQLILAHADLQFGTPPSLWQAALGGEPDVVKLLLSEGLSPNLLNKDGWSPLRSAASEDHVNVVELLLQNGADVNLRDKDGYTALMLAASYGYVTVVELLLRNGADVNLQDKDGWTPLMSAASYGHVNAVELLLQKGADVTLQNKNGHTVLTLSNQLRVKHRKKIKLLIEKYSCQKIFAEQRAYAQIFQGTKLLSHTYSVSGTQVLKILKYHLRVPTVTRNAATRHDQFRNFPEHSQV